MSITNGEECKMETKPKVKSSIVQHADPVDISFQNIQYTASLGFGKGEKEILHNVSGRFPPSQLIAIMGPSGAGKSTLLDILSGFRISGVKGQVTVNGNERCLVEFHRMSCYITQNDPLQMYLTVKENMKVAADLKLGTKYNDMQKWAIIEEILLTLGLHGFDTKTSQLSGGEKKRLSIALEIVNNPPIIFLDEPTTGLDSASCYLCIKLLKKIAMQGRTVVCTIHQPSAKIFDSFDHVYVLAEGECIYQGSPQNLVPYLKSVNLPCPAYHNPADYIIELGCGEGEKNPINLLKYSSQNGKTTEWFEKSNFEVQQKTSRLNEKFSSWSSRQDISQYDQLKIILKRGFLNVQRNTTLIYLRLVTYIVVGLLAGILFSNCGKDGSRVLDNYNALFATLYHISMSSMMITILNFPMEMSLLIKEHFNRWYSLKSYYIMINIKDIPLHILSTSSFCTIVYIMTGQPLDLYRFLLFLVISNLAGFIAESLGHIISLIFYNYVMVVFAASLLFVLLTSFSGYALNFNAIPSYLHWCIYLSFLRYGLEGYVGVIYGMKRPTLTCEKMYCHFKYPTKFLNAIVMDGDAYIDCIIALTIMVVVCKISTYILLRRRILSLR